MADPRELTPAELVARGLLPAGPLAPAVTSKNPAVNEQNIREVVNPTPMQPSYMTPINPIKVAGHLHHAAGVGLGKVAGALGGLNLGGAMMSPAQKELRSRQLGNQFRDIGEAAMMPMARAGRAIAPIAQSARPMFTSFITRLGQQMGLAGTQKAMEGGGPGDVAKSAAIGGVLQGVMEAPAKVVKMILSSKAGSAILSEAANKYRDLLKSFEARQQFDKEFVGELNDLRAQGYKEQAAKLSSDYAQKVFGHKVEGQKLTADWEKKVLAQETVKEQVNTAHMNDVATRLTKDWDARVPAWQGMPQTVEGVIDRVYGQGQPKVQAAFRKSLDEIAEQAAGKVVKIPAPVANALDMIGVQSGPKGTKPSGINGLIGDGSDMAVVDAAELAKKVLGLKSSLDDEVYKASVKALTDAGLGNAKANAEYAAAQALREYVNKTQAVQFIDKPMLFPDKLLGGLTQETKLKSLTTRLPEEDALRGTIASAREGYPAALPDIPKPVQGPLAPKPVMEPAPLPIKTDPNLSPANAPVEPSPEDLGVTMRDTPGLWKLMGLGSAVGGALGGPLGGGYGHYGVGGAAGGAVGALLSHLLPPQVAFGPISNSAEAVLTKSPGVAAGIARAILGGGEVSPEDRAEIEQAQREGRTAASDPRLSLDLDPSETR